MIAVARFLSWLALAGSIVPAVLFVKDQITLDQTKLWMLAATIVWFASAPMWMNRRDAS